MGRRVFAAWLALAGCVTGGQAPSLLASGAAPVRVARDGDRGACPERPGVASPGCPEPDGDGDGYVDRVDRCPGEAGEQDGCPFTDSDNDGFLDAQDGCRDEVETRNGYADADGCPDEVPADLQAITGVLAGVKFDANKAVLHPSSRVALDAVVATLLKYPEVRIEVSGHTDSKAQWVGRVDLTSRRAVTIKRYLIDHGVDAARVESVGFGPDRPIDTNKTEAGRMKNRRIEIAILAR